MHQQRTTIRHILAPRRMPAVVCVALLMLLALAFAPLAPVTRAQEATPPAGETVETSAGDAAATDTQAADESQQPVAEETEPPTEIVTEPPAEAATEPPTEVVTEAPIAPVTEVATGQPTLAPTQPPTLAPTAPVTNRDLSMALQPLPGETVTVGSDIQARVTWAAESPAPEGTITYRLHTGAFDGENDACPAAADATAAQEPVPAGAVGAPDATPVTVTAAGAWSWVGVYTPANDAYAAKTVCRSFTVAKATPALTASTPISQPVASDAPAGATVLAGTDQSATGLRLAATLEGAFQPGGTLTYTVFADAACTPPLAGLTGFPSAIDVTAAGDQPQSAPFDLAAPGDYSWQAAYSGDANNTAATSVCQTLTAAAAPAPMTLSVVSQRDVSFGTLSPDTATVMDDGQLGYVIEGAMTIEVSGPPSGWVVNCAVTVTAGEIPAGALSWRLDGGDGSWTPFTTETASCSPVETNDGATLTYSYRLVIPADTPPGSFSYALSYTVAPADGE